jgi:hypothetical protein
VPRGDLAAEHGDTRRGDGHGERRAMRATIDAAVGADVHVFRVDRARVHADLAADDHARVGLAHEREREPFGRIRPHAVADRRGTGRERQESPGAGDPIAVGSSVRDLLGRDVALLGRVEDAERDQVAVRGRVRDVAGGQERRRGKALAHRAQVLKALRQREGPGAASATGVGRRQQDVLPLRIEVTVVPRDVLVDGRPRGRVHGDVLDQALADHPHATPVAQRLTVFRASPHHFPRAMPVEL